MSTDSIHIIRRLLLALMVFGLIGMAVDLLFLEHYEDSAQTIPLAMIAVALLAAGIYAWTGSARSVRGLQLMMVVLIAVGLLGIGLHYKGNLEFQLDMDPTASHWELFNKVMHAKAPPALAPAAMVQLGLLGLVFCYRHPVLRQRQPTGPDDPEPGR